MDIDKKYDQGQGFKFTFTFLILCLCGQLCWNVENQWFNTFLYRKITQNVSYVTAMVIISATLTCISTFIFGAISDRRGKRKRLMGWGYIAWGASTILVGVCEYMTKIPFSTPAVAITVAATMVVALDGVMSFIGSIAYDAMFNAWTNDHTTEKNKGFIGTIYGIMPVIATILGTVAGGAVLAIGGDPTGNYQLLFWLMGLFVSISGILTLIFVKDRSNLKPQVEGSLIHQATASFRFKELKNLPNIKEMILACIVICVYFISFNFYFVHLGNWAIFELGFEKEFDFGLIEGISMLFGIILAFPVSKLINKDRIPLVCLIGLITSIVGLLLVYFFVNKNTVDGTTAFSLKNIPLIIACFFFGTGEILMTEACMIWVRGLFPEAKRGQFEGIRCVFFVWIPMLIGTLCGDFIIKQFGNHGVDAYGMKQYYPPAQLFLWASVVVLVTFIPLYFATVAYKKRIKAKKLALSQGIVDPTLFDAIPDEETINKAKEIKK